MDNFIKIKNFMNRLTSWRIPGNSITIYIDNRRVFDYSSGYSDVENKMPMTGNELLNIYSCSKVTTVTAALQLYEKGIFYLTIRFASIFRNFVICTSRIKTVIL